MLESGYHNLQSLGFPCLHAPWSRLVDVCDPLLACPEPCVLLYPDIERLPKNWTDRDELKKDKYWNCGKGLQNMSKLVLCFKILRFNFNQTFK